MFWSSQFRPWRIFPLAIVGLLLTVCIAAHAKDAPVNAIVLYDGPGEAAYMQITGLTLNNKTEVRVCEGVPKFNKQGYDALAKMQLAGATSLERTSAGMLTLTVDSKLIC